MLAVVLLDAASVSLLDELVGEGRLPVLAELRKRGRTTELESPSRYMTASTYDTLWSGLSPAAHGIYNPFQWSPEEQRVRYVTAFPRSPSFWERHADAVGRTVVVDPYEAAPPKRVNGVCISGWQFSNRVVMRRWSRPSAALRRWERRFGRSLPAEEVFGRPSERGLNGIRRALLGASARAAALVEELVPLERPDLLLVSLSSIHIGGHQLWDPRAVLGGPQPRPELERALRDLYVEADAALGRIVGTLPTGADLIVLSPHGMGENVSRVDLLPQMLAAVLDPGRGTAGNSWRFRATVPTGLRAAIARALPDAVATELGARVELRGVDWSRTRAFVLPSDSQGFVRLNLRGRERLGIVDPGDVDAMCEEIADGLSTFVLPDGSPAIASVDRIDEVLPPGPRSHLLPDLVVRWSRHPTTEDEVLASARFGVVRRQGTGSGRSGDHTGEAWALVVAGRSRQPAVAASRSITDVAATVAALHGQPTAGEPLLVPVPTAATA